MTHIHPRRLGDMYVDKDVANENTSDVRGTPLSLETSLPPDTNEPLGTSLLNK